MTDKLPNCPICGGNKWQDAGHEGMFCDTDNCGYSFLDEDVHAQLSQLRADKDEAVGRVNRLRRGSACVRHMIDKEGY